MNDSLAGIELDALIAQRVMGLPKLEIGGACPYCGGDTYLGSNRAWCVAESKWLYSPYKEYGDDIAAAWEVVNRLLPKWEMHISPNLFDTMVVCNPYPFFQEKQICVVEKTTPLAICIAALRAIDMDETK